MEMDIRIKKVMMASSMILHNGTIPMGMDMETIKTEPMPIFSPTIPVNGTMLMETA